jgi:hypothetical protein
MNGATIQEHPCPRCAIRRTVRIATASFCFNCRLQWGSQWGKPLGATVEPRLEPPYPFTVAETARLTIYRAAIQAGFYSDQSAPAGVALQRPAVATRTVAGRQRTSAEYESVIDSQLSEWLAPQRR